MEYTPHELADALGISKSTILRSYVPNGCPHRRSGRRIWICGTDFAAWVRETMMQNPRKMEPDEAWCVRCREPVRMLGPFEEEMMPSGNKLLKGKCAQCKQPVSRIQKKK
jgi:uncharacterized protein with PIN domain